MEKPIEHTITGKKHGKKRSTPEKPLTLTEKKFIAEYLVTRNATEAGLRVFNATSRVSASVMGGRLLQRPNVRQKIFEYADGAIDRMEKLSVDAKSEHVRFLANSDILDRAGFSAPKQVTENRTLVINVSGESASRYKLPVENLSDAQHRLSDVLTTAHDHDEHQQRSGEPANVMPHQAGGNFVEKEYSSTSSPTVGPTKANLTNANIAVVTEDDLTS